MPNASKIWAQAAKDSPAPPPASDKSTPSVSPAPLASPEKVALPGSVPEELEALEGVRIPDFAALLKKHFPASNAFQAIDFLPLKNGGTSFTGLVTRLLGVGLDRTFEGLRTRRYFYVASQNNTPIGVAHGSSDTYGAKQIDVIVVYTAGGTIKEVMVQGLPKNVEADLEKGSYLKQFQDKSTEDFEVTLGKRGRIKARGSIFRILRYPPQSETRAYFEKIFRCLRFNTSFMDVAFFITQHPDLAEKTSDDGSTEELKTGEASEASPESFVKGKDQGSPIDGKLNEAPKK